jgi:hypothetical protein
MTQILNGTGLESILDIRTWKLEEGLLESKSLRASKCLAGREEFVIYMNRVVENVRRTG